MARQKFENGITILKNIIFRKNKNKDTAQTEKSFEYFTINPEDFLESFSKSLYKGKEDSFMMSSDTQELLSVVTAMLDYYPCDKVTFDNEGILCMSSNEKFYNLSVKAGKLLHNLTKSFKKVYQDCNEILPYAQTKSRQDFILDMLSNSLLEERALEKAVEDSLMFAVLMTDDDKIKGIAEYEAQIEREKSIYTETMSDYYEGKNIYGNEEVDLDPSVLQ